MIKSIVKEDKNSICIDVISMINPPEIKQCGFSLKEV